jgi:hypothetical protein
MRRRRGILAPFFIAEEWPQFVTAGIGGNNYAGGQINSVWTNWFGGAFNNLVRDYPG